MRVRPDGAQYHRKSYVWVHSVKIGWVVNVLIIASMCTT
jgi:hypothetical protein